MKSKHLMKIYLEFDSEKEVEIVKKALSNQDTSHERRSETNITSNKNVLHLDINAEDRTALKASANGYLKLIYLCKSLMEAK